MHYTIENARSEFNAFLGRGEIFALTAKFGIRYRTARAWMDDKPFVLEPAKLPGAKRRSYARERVLSVIEQSLKS